MSFGAEPSTLSYTAIRRYAERIGEHYGIYDRAGSADIRALVRELGGTVAYGEGRESLSVSEPGNFTIYLPHMTSSRRDRFTIAHELGHYFLHYLHAEREGVVRFGRGDRNLAETQANVFASSLVMPEEQFRKWHRVHGGDKFAIAKIFEVSPAAVEVRAEVLGLSQT